MRKTLVPLLILMPFYYLNAQNEFGLDLGINRTWRDGYSSTLPAKDITTFRGGVFMHKMLSKKFGLHSNLDYYPKGLKFTHWHFVDNMGNDIGEGTVRIRFDYIELNVLAFYEMPNLYKKIFPEIKWYVGAGPYLSYAFGGNTGVKKFKMVNGASQPKLADPDFSVNRRVDAGISFQFLSKGGAISGLSFDLGLVRVNKTGNQRLLNRSLSLTLFFPLT